MIARLIILHVILAGLLVVGWQVGLLGIIWQADHVLALPIIGTLIGIAILMLALRRPEGALWLADKLPVVGLALTVIALLWASNGDLEAIVFKREILQALVGNLLGVLGYGWVELCVRYGK